MGKFRLCPITGLQLSTMAKGRMAVRIPDHPKASSSGYVLRYRYIMEQKLGRYLKSGEEVHHKDDDKTNDDIDNLELMTKGEHAKYHNSVGILRKRIMNYDRMKELRLNGFGYRKIAKIMGYKVGGTKHAIRTIDKELGGVQGIRHDINGYIDASSE